ncbi:hypothetical protein LTR20_001655 [Exophiala xenobiotica]|nr:hypothetical protein LTS13_006367 [Exophiala xenobiotica]KAK5471390.1 hypothetical protein LTR20_001655 [Exophiala xenobiotica]KAK5489352.1 hypothetical protein LTR26_004671 [Exophiala xenobiotica]KAK5502885.1 hypothetical protein LTR83_002983 [Exophiala xenobiotica]
MSSEEEEVSEADITMYSSSSSPAQPVYGIPLEILWRTPSSTGIKMFRLLESGKKRGDFDVDDEILEEADREDQEQATAAGDPLSGAELTWQSTMRRWLQIRMAQDPAEGPVRLGE